MNKQVQPVRKNKRWHKSSFLFIKNLILQNKNENLIKIIDKKNNMAIA